MECSYGCLSNFDLPPPDSPSGRNKLTVPVQRFGRSSPAEGLPRPGVERESHGATGTVHAQVRALREILPQEPVGVFVRSALPGALRIAEVDLEPRVDPQSRVLSHLRTLIPDERPPELFGQDRDRTDDCGTFVTDYRGIPAGQDAPAVVVTAYRPDHTRWDETWRRRQT